MLVRASSGSSGGSGNVGASGKITTSDWSALNNSGTVTISGLGFTPKKINWYSFKGGSASCFIYHWDYDLNPNTYGGWAYSNNDSRPLDDGSVCSLKSVTSDGFVFKTYNADYGMANGVWWTAIG